MKGIKKVFIMVILLSFFTGCNAVNNNKKSSSSPTSSPLHSPAVFNPYNPGDWQANEENWDNELGITNKDYYIENFYLSMLYEDAIKYFPSEVKSTTEKTFDSFNEKTLIFDSLILVFLQEKDETSFLLYSVEVTGAEYVTPRELHVGDNIDTLISLYGIPWHVSDNEWSFLDKDGFYELFHVTVLDGVVKKYVFTEWRK